MATEINNIEPTQYGTSTQTDAVKTVVNTVNQSDNHDQLLLVIKKIQEKYKSVMQMSIIEYFIVI